jgi:hypothetical protein
MTIIFPEEPAFIIDTSKLEIFLQWYRFFHFSLAARRTFELKTINERKRPHLCGLTLKALFFPLACVSQNLSAVARAHSFSEAVFNASLPLLRLICP